MEGLDQGERYMLLTNTVQSGNRLNRLTCGAEKGNTCLLANPGINFMVLINGKRNKSRVLK